MSSQAVQFLQRENTRLHKENEAYQRHIQHLEKYVEALANLYWESRNMLDSGDKLHHLDQILEKAITIIGAKDGSLLCLEPDTNELVFTLVHGQLRQELPGHRIPGDKGVAGWVMLNQMPVIVNEPQQDWRFSLEVDQEFAFLTQSILCVPVKCGQKLLGVIEFVNKEPEKFKDVDLHLVQVLAHIAATAISEDACPLPEAAPPTDMDTFNLI